MFPLVTLPAPHSYAAAIVFFFATLGSPLVLVIAALEEMSDLGERTESKEYRWARLLMVVGIVLMVATFVPYVVPWLSWVPIVVTLTCAALTVSITDKYTATPRWVPIAVAAIACASGIFVGPHEMYNMLDWLMPRHM